MEIVKLEKQFAIPGRIYELCEQAKRMSEVESQPIATVYVKGVDNMYKYLKKGYQVQDVVDSGSANELNHSFLMVKY